MPEAGAQPWAALVLTGGRSRRMGRDKANLRWGGATMLEHVTTRLRALGAKPIVLVGPHQQAGCYTVREDPPFSGPLAGIGAGVAQLVEVGLPASALVAILTCDAPTAPDFLPRAAAHWDAHPDAPALDGVHAQTDYAQYLCGLYRFASLRRALGTDHSRTAGDSPVAHLENRSVRHIFRTLQLAPLADPDQLSRDFDTPADVAAAGHGPAFTPNNSPL